MVEADIPALLGMDLLDREQISAETTVNHLARRTRIEGTAGRNIYIDQWVTPMTRSTSAHSYVPMEFRRTNCTHMSVAELEKVHRQFYHPTAEKLFNLLKKAKPEEAAPETRRNLEELTTRCDPCQRIRTAPNRFRVSFGAEHVQFNERVLMDIMYINGDPILHIVDEGTHFSAEKILPAVSTDSVWQALLKCWGAIYTGLPNRALLDQGS